MQKRSSFSPFLIGLVTGVLGTVFLPGYVRPYLPAWIAGKTVVVKGTVEAKQKKENSLLLTVETPEGVLLATFKKKVDEINLLINDKDSIEFTLPKYTPFIDDPKIVRVTQGAQAVPEPAPGQKPKEQAAKETRPRHQENRSAGPAPVPVSAGTRTPGRK